MQQDLSHSKHIKCLNETINTHKLCNMYVPDRAQHKVGKEIIVPLAYFSEILHLDWKYFTQLIFFLIY